MKKFVRLMALLVAAVLCVVPLVGCGGGGEEKVTLRIYNWGDYIDPDVLQDFKDANPDIRVIYDTFDSNESMLAKMDGGAKYDILIPSDYMVEKLIKENRLAEIDLTKIANIKHIDPSFMNQSFDPQNKYSVPYTWGTLGILYNTTMVNEEIDSWGVLFDAKYKNNIYMYNSVRDSMALALKYLGYSMNDRDTAHLNQAGDLLRNQKKNVKAYKLDDIKEAMQSNTAALAVVYSGDAMLCMDVNEDLDYVVPKEGTNLFYDAMVVTKDCANMDAAYRFINFMCDPEIAKRNYEYVGYSIPNAGAIQLLGEEYTSIGAHTVSAEVREKCEVFADLGEYAAIYNQIWESITLK